MLKPLTLSLLTGILLTAAVLLAPGQPIPETKVTWADNLATIEWAEPLADPKANKNEVPFTILTGPYLGWLTPTEATIGWEVLAEKKVTETPYAALSGTYPVEKIQFRSVHLTNLKPDTAYRYRLKSGNYESKIITFRTLPTPQATALKFAMIGDTQRGDNLDSAEIERKLFTQILAWNPNLVLHLVDMLETGRGDGINGRKAWYRTLTRNRDMRASLFMAPTAGNHCLLGKGHLWYADYFSLVKGAKTQRGDKSQPPYYYSFDVGNVHFVSLCTDSAKVSGKENVADVKHRDFPFTYNEQLAWFENDLKNTQATWKVVFFHAPFHTAGGYPAAASFRTDFGGVCDKYGVQLVLSGHDHSYQKTKRITNAERKVSDTGSVQIVSGGGDIKQFDTAKNRPDWNLVHKKINHYVQVEVSPTTLQFTAVDVKGDVFDTWRLPLKGQPELVSN